MADFSFSLRPVDSSAPKSTFAFDPIEESALVSGKFTFDPVDDASPTERFAFDSVNDERDAYVKRQLELQEQPIAQKVGEFASALPGAVAQAGGFLLTETLPETFRQGVGAINFFGTPESRANARQNIANSAMLNALDVSDAIAIGRPKLWNYLTGQRQTPEQLAAEYADLQQRQATREKVAAFGADPEITREAIESAPILGALAQPGATTTDIRAQEAIAPITDPTNFIPFGAAAGLLRGATAAGAKQAVKTAPGIAARTAAGALGGAGRAASAVGRAGEAVQAIPERVARTITDNPDAAKLVADRAERVAEAASRGIIGAGGMIASDIAKGTGDVLQAGARALRTPRGSIPIFEEMARQTDNPLAKGILATLDRSGIDRKAAAVGRAAKEGAGASAVTGAASVATGVSGVDPTAAAQNVAEDFAFGTGGGLLGQVGYSDRPEVIRRKEAQDAAWLFQRLETDPRTQGVAKQLLDARANVWGGVSGVDKARAQGYAADEVGKIAQIVRGNPDVDFVFTSEQVGSGGYVIDPRTGRATVALNINSPEVLNRVIGHELSHHIQATGKRPALMRALVGDPGARIDGALVKYGKDGTPTYSPEFQAYRNEYVAQLAKNLDAQIAAEPNPARRTQLTAQRDQALAGLSNDRVAAEEFFVEAIGSILGQRMPNGELVYTRIRRGAMRPGLIQRVLGNAATDALKAGKIGFGSTRNIDPNKIIPQDAFKVVYDYITAKDYLNRGKDFSLEPATEGKGISYDRKWIEANPRLAHQIFGQDNSIKWRIDDTTGEVTGIEGYRTRRELEELERRQVVDFVNAIARDPSSVETREVARENGGTEIQVRQLSQRFLDALAQANSWNPTQIANLTRIAAMLGSDQPGGVVEMRYQPALRGSRYAPREVQTYTVVPYELVISTPEGGAKGQNILIRLFDISQAEQNFMRVREAMGNAGIPMPYASVEQALADLRVAMVNQSRNRQSTGEPMADGSAPTGEPATRPDGSSITPEQRNVLNLMAGIHMPSNVGANPLAQRLVDDGLLNKKTWRSAIKSFRLDRLNSMQDTGMPEFPVNYPALKRNYRPMEQVDNGLTGPSQIGNLPSDGQYPLYRPEDDGRAIRDFQRAFEGAGGSEANRASRATDPSPEAKVKALEALLLGSRGLGENASPPPGQGGEDSRPEAPRRTLTDEQRKALAAVQKILPVSSHEEQLAKIDFKDLDRGIGELVSAIQDPMADPESRKLFQSHINRIADLIGSSYDNVWSDVRNRANAQTYEHGLKLSGVAGEGFVFFDPALNEAVKFHDKPGGITDLTPETRKLFFKDRPTGGTVAEGGRIDILDRLKNYLRQSALPIAAKMRPDSVTDRGTLITRMEWLQEDPNVSQDVIDRMMESVGAVRASIHAGRFFNDFVGRNQWLVPDGEGNWYATQDIRADNVMRDAQGNLKLTDGMLYPVSDEVVARNPQLKGRKGAAPEMLFRPGDSAADINRIRRVVERASPDGVKFFDALLKQIGLEPSAPLYEELRAAQPDRARPIKGEEVAKVARGAQNLFTGQKKAEISNLQKFYANNVWRLNIMPREELVEAFEKGRAIGPTIDVTEMTNYLMDWQGPDRELVTQPVVNIVNKLEESRHSSAIPTTKSLSELGIAKLDQAAMDAFDAYFGNDKWIVKRFDDEAFAGAEKEGQILFPERLRTLLDTKPEAIASLPIDRYAVQKALDVRGATPEGKAKGETIVKGSEARVHVITDRVGNVRVVPYATWQKGDWIPATIMTDEVKGYEEAARQAIAALPPEDRQGSMFGVDVVRTKDGYGVVELNPTKEGGLISGYLEENPLVQDAVIAALRGQLPIHAKIGRLLLAIKAKEQAEALGVPKEAQKSPYRLDAARYAKRTKDINAALESMGLGVYSPYGNSWVTGVRDKATGEVIEQGSEQYNSLPEGLRRQLDEHIWLSKEGHDRMVTEAGSALYRPEDGLENASPFSGDPDTMLSDVTGPQQVRAAGAQGNLRSGQAFRKEAQDLRRVSRNRHAQGAVEDRDQVIAAEENRLRTKADDLPDLPDLVNEGNEHIITASPKGPSHVRKFTRNGRFGYSPYLGYSMDFETQQYVPVLGVQEATPAEYLTRIALANEIFGNSFELAGYGRQRGGDLTIITDHPLIDGQPPTQKEIDDHMASMGFRKIEVTQDLAPILVGSAFSHPERGIVVVDARPDNWRKLEDGTMIPLDLMISDELPKDEVAKLYRPDEGRTVPESASTLADQWQSLQDGQRSAVLVPKGTQEPPEFATGNGISRAVTSAGVFYFDTSKLSRSEIRKAVAEDRVGDVLGYGIARKPVPEDAVGAVTVRRPDGVERQAVVTDAKSLPRVLSAAALLAKAGDRVVLEDPREVVARRQ